MSAGSKALVVAGLAGIASLAGGCLGGRGGGPRPLGQAPWDRALTPPAGWILQPPAKGTVTAVSADSLSVDIKLDQGTARVGDLVTFVMPTPGKPAARYFSDEVREIRVATARVVSVRSGGCRAEFIENARVITVMPGDKATVRNP